MIFKSRRDLFFKVFMIPIIVLMFLPIASATYFAVLEVLGKGESYFKPPYYWLGNLILLAVIANLLWIYFGTRYELKDGFLYWRQAFIRGKIEIRSIRKIQKGKTMLVAIRPATAQKGLIIKYNMYDEIYITPNTSELFIEEILKLNPNIEIVE